MPKSALQVILCWTRFLAALAIYSGGGAGAVAAGAAPTVANHSFEELGDGGFPVSWTPIGSPESTQASFVRGYDSYLSLRIDDRSSSSSCGVRSSEINNVQPDTTYTVSAQCFVESGIARVYLEFYNADGVKSSHHVCSTATGKWDRVSVTATAPTDASTMKVALYSALSDVGVSYCDNVRFGREIVDIGSRRQLFIDNHIVADLGSAVRRQHAAEKHEQNPVITSDKPWENKITFFPNVIKEGETYKMWYVTPESLWEVHSYRTALATSSDGVHWTKPLLNLNEIGGSKANNIIWSERVGSIVPNPAGKGYYMYRSDHNAPKVKLEYAGYYSASGVEWGDRNVHIDKRRIENSRYGGKNYLVQDIEHLSYDPTTKNFILVFKMTDLEYSKAYGNGQTYTREFFVAQAPNMGDLYSADIGVHMDGLADSEDTLPGMVRTDPYFVQVVPYHGAYLCFTTLFQISEVRQSNGWAHAGELDVHLHFSRDLTKQFYKPFRKQPILKKGQRKSDAKKGKIFHDPANNDWDWGMVSVVCPPVITEDRVLIYYNGVNCQHNQAASPGKFAGIGLATWRLDGFVSIDSDSTEDVITSKPLRFSGRQLVVNSRAIEAGGELRIEIRDADDKLLKNKSDLITGDSLHHVVKWNGDANIGELSGTPIVLKFYSRNTELYALEFRAEETKAVNALQ